MNIEFRGVDVQITDAMKSFIEGKLKRFNRYLKEAGEDQVEVIVSISAVRARHKDYAGDSKPVVYRVRKTAYKAKAEEARAEEGICEDKRADAYTGGPPSRGERKTPDSGRGACGGEAYER